MNICPHLRFGDPNVLDAFHPGCPRLEGPWYPGNCIQRDSRGPQGVCGVEVNCAPCKTRIIFYLSESDDETTTFWAKVSRRIAKSAGSVADPTWIAYLYMEVDFGRLQEEWQANAMSRPPQNGEEVGGRLGQRWGKVFAGLCITGCFGRDAWICRGAKFLLDHISIDTFGARIDTAWYRLQMFCYWQRDFIPGRDAARTSTRRKASHN